MSKQVSIYLSRKITLNRADKPPVELTAGRNLVDVDVATHDFVKAHTIAGSDTIDVDMGALRARVASLEAELSDMNTKQRARIDELTESERDFSVRVGTQKTAIEGLHAQLDAANEAATASAARIVELEQLLEQKTADLTALASMTPPPAAEAKHAKAKA